MTKSGITGLQLRGSEVPFSPNGWVNSRAVSFFFLRCKWIQINKAWKLLHPVAVAKVEKTLLARIVHNVGGWKNKDLLSPFKYANEAMISGFLSKSPSLHSGLSSHSLTTSLALKRCI